MPREAVEPERVELVEEGLLIGFRSLTFDRCVVANYEIWQIILSETFAES
jgi:hypothetical protein